MRNTKFKKEGMQKITAKFTSICFETGYGIAKGETMYFDYGTRKCYSMRSNRAKFEDTQTAPKADNSRTLREQLDAPKADSRPLSKEWRSNENTTMLELMMREIN